MADMIVSTDFDDLPSRKLNIEESEESMEQDDTDKDGSLTWEEHIYAVYKMDVDSLKEYQESELDDPEAKALLIKVSVHLETV